MVYLTQVRGQWQAWQPWHWAFILYTVRPIPRLF